MNSHSSRSSSANMSIKDAFKALGLNTNASIDEINHAFKSKLSEIQKRHAERPESLVVEADALYSNYRTAYMSRDGANEDNILPLTITGPETLLNMFNIPDVQHQSIKVQMQSQAQYKDGKLLKNESSKTESFINKDGKREIKVYENGKLVKHTIDGKNMLK